MEKVKFEGKEFTLTQQPYIHGVIGKEPFFIAEATDSEGNLYQVIWEVVENWEEVAENGDDQELVEDWEKPTNVKKI